MSDRPSACVRCGGLLPFRLDSRGRPALYCSGACRAAASRERAAAESRREVQEVAARLPVIEDELRRAADDAHKRGWVEGYAEGYRAAQEAQRAASGVSDGVPGEASRQQRRAVERAASKRRR